ncbi:hypothetical protein ScPMuIL_013672 [Solemya velum]
MGTHTIHCLVTVLLTASLTLGASDWSQYEAFVLGMSKNQTFLREFREHLEHYQSHNLCLSVLSNDRIQSYDAVGGRPNSPSFSYFPVHKLTPADVKVVAAMGDSLTAGNGINARTIIGLLRQNRGVSWSIGGDDTFESHSTLPNALKTYSYPNTLHGFSVKSGRQCSRNAHLNVAKPGAKAKDLPSQARMLVEKMKDEPGVDFSNDWKVITIFIGGNDICKYCTDKNKYSVNNFKKHIKKTLDILHKRIPRAFVNMVLAPNAIMARDLNVNIVCAAMHLFLCPCAAYPWNEKAAETEIQITKGYRRVTKELVESGRYDTKQDFTVVVQPLFTETTFPLLPDGKPDLSYFAPDCFHFSAKGHAAAAESLWNNMNEPVGSKKMKWTPGEPIECPLSKYPYFYTNKNSNTTLLMLSGKEAGAAEVELWQTQNPTYIGLVVSVAVSCTIMLSSVVGVIHYKNSHMNPQIDKSSTPLVGKMDNSV